MTATSCVRTRSLAVVALLLAAVACGGGDVRPPATPAVSVRDSAGIEIVASARPRWENGEGWTVNREPAVAIGLLDGPQPYLLAGVVGATRFGDGRVAIALANTSEIRLYDARGSYLSTTGRRGQGPGEFSKLAYLAPIRGDSMITFDKARARLTVFDGQGGFARSKTVPHGGDQGADPRGVFEDGTLLISWPIGERERDLAGARVTEPPPEGPQVRTAHFAMIRTDDTSSLHLGLLPSTRWGVTMGPVLEKMLYAEVVKRTGSPRKNPGMIIYMAVPQILTAVGPRVLWRGDASGFEIHAHSSDGTLTRIVRGVRERELIPASAKIEPPVHGRTDMGSVSMTYPLRPERFVWPDRYPAFDGLHADRVGNLWVRDFVAVDAAIKPVPWAVFDSTGAWLGPVTTPAGLRIFEIGDDYVLGVVRDSLDIEQVRLHPLAKPASGR